MTLNTRGRPIDTATDPIRQRGDNAVSCRHLADAMEIESAETNIGWVRRALSPGTRDRGACARRFSAMLQRAMMLAGPLDDTSVSGDAASRLLEGAATS